MDLCYILADPSGNTTAFVLSPVPPHQYGPVARAVMERLKAEQVAFLHDGRMDMMGGEFCGNASRSFALWQALQRIGQRTPAQPQEAVFRLRDIRRDSFTVEGCMEAIESRLSVGRLRFTQLFSDRPGREEVVTLFMAVLEMLKLGKVHVRQKDMFRRITLVPGRSEADGEA